MTGLFSRMVGRWFDSRLHLAKFVRKAVNHVFPDHWSFLLGEIAMYSFIILVITGAFLALFFNASAAKVVYHGSYAGLQGVHMSAAYKSAIDISFDVRGGLLVRQMHHWAALIFVCAIVTHIARIFFTAAYRRPREINWIIGLTLLLLALGNGYFGYSIPGDLLSGAGLRVAYSITISVPIIGPWLAYVFLGGNIPSDMTIPRMYGWHIFLVPALISILLGLHLGIIWRQKHTNYPGPRRTDATIVGSRLWPSYTAKSLGLFFLLFGLVALLGALVQIDPIWVYGPYDPAAASPGAQPDWYLGWIEGAMRMFPAVNLHFWNWLVPEVFFPAFLFPCLVFLALYLFPFFERFISLDRQPHNVLRLPYQQPFNTAFGCGAFIFFLTLLFAGSDDVIAVATGGSVVIIRAALRTAFFVAPPLTFALVYLLCKRKNRRSESAATLMAENPILEDEPTASALEFEKPV
ncbi:MAG TPA: cytochrome bc complex cytochrome b subunit [Terriglobales bacterium]|nr:cytochrome bc complex cytochrome b subunit [Terriglobales bacterium]